MQVVIHPSDREFYDRATEGLGLPPPVNGGASRQESVRFGLEGMAAFDPDLVIIHDAVRPFVGAETISAVIAALDRAPGAIAGVPLTDTLKRCAGPLVSGTVERTDLWRAQTPQGFRHVDILEAHRRVYRDNPLVQAFTDDSAVAEAVGLAIEMVPGSDDNFKITTEADLLRASFMMQHGRGDGSADQD